MFIPGPLQTVASLRRVCVVSSSIYTYKYAWDSLWMEDSFSATASLSFQGRVHSFFNCKC